MIDYQFVCLTATESVLKMASANYDGPITNKTHIEVEQTKLIRETKRLSPQSGAIRGTQTSYEI
jgi:hypothetical protein